jgi:hypothetical protein
MKMKRTLTALSFGLALGLLTQAPVASADETVTTTKSTTYSGVVSEMNPSNSTIILRSESSSAPVSYTYSKETTFVDSAGNPVSSSAILNSPVTVEYSNEGGRTVVRRVVQTGPARVQQKTVTEKRID